MDILKSILFVLPADAIGGAETKFFNIIKRLTHMKSTLLTQRSIAQYFSALGSKIYTFEEFGCHDPMLFSLKKMIRYARTIAHIGRSERSDCIVGIMHTGSFYVSAAKDIFLLRTPYIGTIEGNISAYLRIENRTTILFEQALLWYLLRRPDRLLVPTNGVKDDLVNNFRVPPDKVSVIYNGIDIDTVRTLASEPGGLSDEYPGIKIVTACRLNTQKDFNTLLLAMKEVREKTESRLFIVGDGELRNDIICFAKKLGIEKDVVITGFQKNPFNFIKKADVFVLSSFAEGFGNVIVEAMALGIPVVATDCPSGPGEIIQDGVNGFLVPIKDHHKMADAIMKLLTGDKKRDECISNGKSKAEILNAETMTKNFKKLILDVC
jgi:glycosyltransferase involved in cell wall biosynthesis